MQNNTYNLNETILLRNSDSDIILKIEKSEISKLNKDIIDFLNSTYNKYGFSYGCENKTIEIENVILHTEYLSKFVNNKTLFGKIAEKYKLKTTEEFTSYVKNNLYRLYDFDGADFQDNYDLIKYTALKGKRGEDACRKKFEKMYYNTYKKEIKIELPENSQEDIDGIDGKFIINGKKITLQIKPYTRSIKKENKIFIYSKGSLSMKTHYLLLYREKWSNNRYVYDYIMLKNGAKYQNIKYNNGYYETDIKNIIPS